ncbi:Isoleucyl-tRNA synthetase [uncultured Candidatus Thioglobus sp.]|nr:Isoleucyl-tRNA synthetase [uncultured Candidatus Thioglobus sp.]
MKANLANREGGFLQKWQEDDLYAQIRAHNKGKPKFTLHDGPPYANGDIHIGHAVNKVLKDIIVKSKSLSGFDAPYVPGWDCHGLPIELNVEKKKGKVGHKIDANTFRAECRKYADTQVIKQKTDFQRLGILGDWNNPYLTKSFDYEANIVRALGKIVENNHVSKGYKPVHWCTECGSALAEAEVEYQDKQSDAIDVKFKLTDESKSKVLELMKPHYSLPHFQEIREKSPFFMVIWTTTPWTLPANEAVAINPDLEYIVTHKDLGNGAEYYIWNEEAVNNQDSGFRDAVSSEGINNREIHRTGSKEGVQGDVTGYKSKPGKFPQGISIKNTKKLENLLLEHPFYDKKVPIILGDHVTTDAGTGCVHTAPAHGQEDYAVGLKYNLPVECPVDGRGVFFADTPLFGGQFIFKANASVIETLKEKNALLHHESITHSYPHCWRHKTPVIFRATPQWFVSMQQNGLRDAVNSEIPKVEWIPDWGKKRIELMVGNRPDWCISRQRSWGAPITLFTHKQTGELHPDTQAIFAKVAEKIEQGGIEAWFEASAEDFIGSDAKDYDKTTDTLDVWFDSGVSHFAVLNAREGLSDVADLYLEGSDQHRGWFQSSMITSVAMNGKAPYKQVLTHGFTVDKDGKKMSKSLGNVMSPQKVVNNLGADILRLWIASTDYTGEMTVSDEILKGASDGYRKIRNTIRFMLANMHDFSPDEHLIEPDKMLRLDSWIVGRTAMFQMQIKGYYDTYQFHTAVKLIIGFCTNTLGNFYLDIIKDRQYTCQTNSLARRSAQTALYHMTHTMVRLIAPVLSFTAEEIWACMPNKPEKSIFLEEHYNIEVFLQYVKTDSSVTSGFFNFVDKILEISQPIHKQMELMRNEKIIGSSLGVEIDIFCEENIYAVLNELGDELRFVFITSYARIHSLSEKTQDCIEAGEGVFFKVTKSEHQKCVRCWHHRSDVGANDEHPELCGRCVENVAGDGEKRCFA